MNFRILRLIWNCFQILEEEKCKPKRQMVFAKTHKTGSSTFQNILFRHCLQNNLTIAFPTAKSWMFGFKKSFSANQVNGYELEQNKHTTSTTFDMFLFHSVWNYSEVRKVVPYGPSVTLIRDPVDTFESGYVYFNNHPKVNRFMVSKWFPVKFSKLFELIFFDVNLL